MPHLIKICGITRVEDAQAACREGATAVGFVFWPRSPRLVAPDVARAIVATLPAGVLAVGVFVNQTAADVNETVDRAGLTTVQLHGDESPDYARAMTRPVIKSMTLESEAPALDDWPAGTMWLIDAVDAQRRGGTGRQVDWTRAAAVAKSRRVLLAGGLNPANVADAIGRVRPFGIDVSSGVETSPGIKDHALLGALFEAVHAVNADH